MSTLTPVTADFTLAEIDPSSTAHFDGSKKDAEKALEKNGERLAALQE